MAKVDESVLKEYVATANNPEYDGDWDVINSKFPEFGDVDHGILKEYVATANNPDYDGDFATINSKFPEFGLAEPEVKKKEPTEPTDPPVVEETEKVTVSESPTQDGGSVSVELDEKEEAEFQKWMTTDPNVKAWREEFISEYGEEPKIEGANYDYRGAWKAGLKPEPTYEPETKKTLHHWGSKGLEGIDLKSQDHPTRWKSDYMEAFGVNPDESGISKEDALLELSKPKEPKRAPQGIVRTTEVILEGKEDPSTVLMSSHGDYIPPDADGKYVAFPRLFPKDPDNQTSDSKDWIVAENDDQAYELAKERGEVLYFDTREEADAVAEGSWKKPKSDPETVDTDPPVDTEPQALTFATYKFEKRNKKNKDRYDYYSERDENQRIVYFKKEKTRVGREAKRTRRG